MEGAWRGRGGGVEGCMEGAWRGVGGCMAHAWYTLCSPWGDESAVIILTCSPWSNESAVKSSEQCVTKRSGVASAKEIPSTRSTC